MLMTHNQAPACIVKALNLLDYFLCLVTLNSMRCF
jgi:hypothetical protein